MGEKRTGRTSRKRLVGWLFFLLSSLGLMAEEPVFDLSVSPEKPQIGKNIYIVVKLDIKTSQKIEITQDELPEGVQLIAGPARRNYRVQTGRWTYTRYHMISWALRSSTPGIYNIPDIKITSKDREIIVPLGLMSIYRRDEVNNKYPLLLNWRQPENEMLWVGQTIPVIAEAENLEQLDFPDRVSVKQPSSGTFVKTSGVGEVFTVPITDELTLLKVPVASWYYTPVTPGEMTIPSLRADIYNLTRYTGPMKLNISPVPPALTTGAIGEFTLNSETVVKAPTLDEYVEFNTVLSGEGNFHYLQKPEIEHEGLIVAEKKEEEKLETGLKGYKGQQKTTWFLMAEKPGDYQIRVKEYNWMDEEGNIYVIPSATHSVTFSAPEAEDSSASSEFLLPLPPQKIYENVYRLYKKPYWFLMLLAPLAVMIFLIIKAAEGRKLKWFTAAMPVTLIFMTSFTVMRGFEHKDKIVQAADFIEQEKYAEALANYVSVETSFKESPGLYINKALLCLKTDNLTGAAYNIRTAERLIPGNSRVEFIKEYIEKIGGLSQQATTSAPVHPDLFFIIFLLLFNGFFWFFWLGISRKGFAYNFTAVCLFILTLASLSGIWYTDRVNSVRAGVIGEQGASLKKVPEKEALQWMELSRGNTVYIEGEWMDQYLIQTEYGLKGWIKQSDIYILEEK